MIVANNVESVYIMWEFQHIPGPYSAWIVKKVKNQIELKRKFGPTSVLLIVNLGHGYEHKGYSANPGRWGHSTQGVNIHFSLNGPLQLTFVEWDEINYVGNRAKDYLVRLEKEML